ncbi:hypothetical protein ACWT_5696 [Actinoplanes sp. SE50]|uniref:hypothetical protein n=1 Tax=Actinoplanes sp. (strain ATCC 31044 / CBS 674.73 / SE50/110) TaxID=134676 RepID=UPI00023ED2DF|nr:hypothetical protein [Actinoplanes sp. SE50/110]AEV86713.1 hypothetical protein ACPL_5826 [Actinoplanes sp. SE50/110]ATO85111.1 hypothetical protein ACWT_5696 [Actinoplanes sp. SE50]SLM02522.1 hypothetical protein ACSP50_5772 [Actinoplanes sp. SE50/110]
MDARAAVGDFPYVWAWSTRTFEYPGVRVRVPWFGDGVDRASQPCRVLVRGGMNSALIEFADGYRVLTSRGGIRRAKSTSSEPATRLS